MPRLKRIFLVALVLFAAAFVSVSVRLSALVAPSADQSQRPDAPRGQEQPAARADDSAAAAPAAASASKTQRPPPPSTTRPGGKVVLPYLYPVHTKLPPAADLRAGVEDQAAKSVSECIAVRNPLPDAPAAHGRRALPGASAKGLLASFMVGDDDAMGDAAMFLAPDAEGPALADDGLWWVGGAGTDLPCTAEMQRALWKSQHPAGGCADPAAKLKFLQTKLKEKAHGLGSALSIVVHDMISALSVGRILVIESSRWSFAPPACGAGNGWVCYFAAPSPCRPPPGAKSVKLQKGSTAPLAAKKDVDQPHFSRSDLPALSDFLPRSCVAAVEQWAQAPSNVYLMGSFQRGADPLLTYWMAQVVRYLLRSPQPWFSTAMRLNLKVVGYPWHGRPVVFEQQRGEIAKYREYFNVFGCHDVHLQAYCEWTDRIFKRAGDTTGRAGDTTGRAGAPIVYISGNTPFQRYQELKALHANASTAGASVMSTWEHPLSSSSAESARWGAASLAVSWTDFWAGVAASGWVCIVQSNWCRMINLLRLTAGRAHCPFVDVGLTMISHAEHRERYCIVNDEWPKKPFSSVLKRFI